MANDAKKPLQYRLEILWEGGTREHLALTRDNYYHVKARANYENPSFYMVQNGATYRVNLIKALSFKLYSFIGNPLDDPSHYDNPIN